MNQGTFSLSTRTCRVDQVGSLLRPQALKDAYARHDNGEIHDNELARIQDASVKELIAKQEAHGISILTDGEYRRLNFQDSFVESMAGFVPKKQTMQFQESGTVGGEFVCQLNPPCVTRLVANDFSQRVVYRRQISFQDSD